jgi:acetyl esterase/lipase
VKVTGGFGLWFSPWLLEYAKLHSAVIIGVDYRLMPEHNGLDMMEDLDDFWNWAFNKSQQYLSDKVELDLEKIMIAGDSAGMKRFCSLFVAMLIRV